MMGEMKLVKNTKINVVLRNTQRFLLTSSEVSLSTNNQYPCILAKEDSAASSHYWRDQDKEVLDNIKPVQDHRFYYRTTN